MPEKVLGHVRTILQVPFPAELVPLCPTDNWHPIRTRLMAAHANAEGICCGYEGRIQEELRK